MVSLKQKEVTKRHCVRRAAVLEHEQLDAIRRVFALADGYASTEPQHILMAWDGGVMTWAEVRQHIQAALSLPLMAKRR